MFLSFVLVYKDSLEFFCRYLTNYICRSWFYIFRLEFNLKAWTISNLEGMWIYTENSVFKFIGRMKGGKEISKIRTRHIKISYQILVHTVDMNLINFHFIKLQWRTFSNYSKKCYLFSFIYYFSTNVEKCNYWDWIFIFSILIIPTFVIFLSFLFHPLIRNTHFSITATSCTLKISINWHS